MTFKGETYESILDLHLLKLTAEKVLEAYEADLMTRRLTRSAYINECETKVNLQKKYIAKLNRLEENLLDDIDRLTSQLKDMQTKVFMEKFVIGRNWQDSCIELGISKTPYFQYVIEIENILKDSKIFKDLKKFLKLKKEEEKEKLEEKKIEIRHFKA